MRATLSKGVKPDVLGRACQAEQPRHNESIFERCASYTQFSVTVAAIKKQFHFGLARSDSNVRFDYVPSAIQKNAAIAFQFELWVIPFRISAVIVMVAAAKQTLFGSKVPAVAKHPASSACT
jgi:hypothetical protein